MSENSGAEGAITLEEALVEIEGLKEQLSGSDIKVFSQNRELRGENGRLRGEVTRLTEECVTLTFSVRGLEKAKAALEKSKSDLEQQVADHLATIAEREATIASLESKIAEIEGRAGELTEQLGIHRSQEIHLSQELERTISTNAEEVARLRTEHTSELHITRQTLEEARAEIERELSERLAARAAEVEGLERRVEAFKEEFLSQEFIAVSAPSAQEGRAFSLLRTKLEGLLGFPGRTLVEQVFRHCGADETTTDPAVLEEAFDALQDTASKLVRSPEQEQELGVLLKSAWQELGLGSAERLDAISSSSEGVAATPDAQAVAEEATEESSSDDEASEPSAEAAPPAPTEEASAEEAPELSEEVDPAAEAVEASADEVAEVAESEAVEEAVEPQEDVANDEAAEVSSPAVDEEVAADEVAEQPAAEEEPSPVAVDPETVPPADEPSVEIAEEASVEASPEPSLLDSEAVTEEDMPPVSEPEEAPEPILDSIDQALAEPSIEDAPVEETSAAEEDSSELMAAVVAEEAVELSVDSSEDVAPAEQAEEAAEVGEEAEAAEPEAELEEPAGSEAPVDEAADEPVRQEQAPEDDEETDASSEEPEAESAVEDADFDSAAAALQNGDFATAFPVFHRLRTAAPTERTYLVGEIAALAGLERFAEAYALGKGLDTATLEDSAEVYKESFESVLVGLAENAESLAERKLHLFELVEFVDDSERRLALLDEIEEIGLRTPREGELSLLQAQHRIGHDDVTEFLIEAMGGLSDKPELFDLLHQNLERYPELAPLSEYMDRLLGSSRDEALEAEGSAKELISGDEGVQELLDEDDPSEELVKVFLEHMLPRTGLKMELPSEEFEDLLNESEPAAFVGALRQALRSVDYTMFFDEIEVLSYDGDDHFLLRSSPEPKATLLFGSDVDDVPPEELRFLVLRELFSMVRRHSHLAHLAAQLDDKLRFTFVKTCLEIHKEAEFQIPEALLAQLEELEGEATEGGQGPEFRSRLESALYAVYQATESDAFLELGDFLFDGQLHKKWLDPLADAFAAKQTGLTVASFAIARDTMEPEDFEQIEESGFRWLYEGDNLKKYRPLRFRLQRLWAMPFKALVSDGEE